MGYSYAYEFEEALELGILPMLLSAVPSMALSIATYVLTALALYTVANRRGLNNPWLAWIPVADMWLLGSISDQYRYVVKNENRSKRKILLILSLISVVGYIVIMTLGVAAVVSVASGAMQGISEEALLGKAMGPVVGLLGVCVPLMGVSIAQMIIRYMAMYDVFTSMDPGNSVMFLVLSIVFHVTEPFFLFFNRHKDGGMPPRKRPAEPVYEHYSYDQPIYEQPQDPPQEPWNRDEPDYL